MKVVVELMMITGTYVVEIIDIKEARNFKTFLENNQDKVIPLYSDRGVEKGIIANHIVGYEVKSYEKEED